MRDGHNYCTASVLSTFSYYFRHLGHIHRRLRGWLGDAKLLPQVSARQPQQRSSAAAHHRLSPTTRPPLPSRLAAYRRPTQLPPPPRRTPPPTDTYRYLPIPITPPTDNTPPPIDSDFSSPEHLRGSSYAYAPPHLRGLLQSRLVTETPPPPVAGRGDPSSCHRPSRRHRRRHHRSCRFRSLQPGDPPEPNRAATRSMTQADRQNVGA